MSEWAGTSRTDGKREDCVLTDAEAQTVMEWLMVSDPWPLSDRQHTLMMEMADWEACNRGFDNWIEAYHAIPKAKAE